MRRRRTAWGAVAGLAVLAVIATPAVVVAARHRTPPLVTATPSPSSSVSVSAPPVGPVGLDGWILSGGQGRDGKFLVWSRAGNRYVPIVADRAWPAPTGDLVVTQKGGHVALLDMATGRSRPLPGNDITAPSWTDDATEVAYTILGTPPKGILVTTATAHVDLFWLAVQCGSRPCGALSVTPTHDDRIAPGERGLLATNDAGTSGRLWVIDLPSHDANGSLPVIADIGGDIAPDGHHVVEWTATGNVVRDRRTNALASVVEPLDLRTVRWIDNRRFLAVTHGYLKEFDLTGHVIASVAWPAAFVDDELPNFTLSRG
jgi:hypothetical protein